MKSLTSEQKSHLLKAVAHINKAKLNEWYELATEDDRKFIGGDLVDNVFEAQLAHNTPESLIQAGETLDWQCDNLYKGSEEQIEVALKANKVFEAEFALGLFSEAHGTLDWLYMQLPAESTEKMPTLLKADKVFEAQLAINTPESIDAAFQALSWQHDHFCDGSDEKEQALLKADRVFDAELAYELFSDALRTLQWQCNASENYIDEPPIIFKADKVFEAQCARGLFTEARETLEWQRDHLARHSAELEQIEQKITQFDNRKKFSAAIASFLDNLPEDTEQNNPTVALKNRPGG